MSTAVVIRPASAADQGAITLMVRAAHLNPMNVRWPNFTVAEVEGLIVGVGQIRPHADGSRELASLAVLAEHQKQGIGRRLMTALLAGQHSPIFLFCEEGMEAYYVRFGFRVVADIGELPKPQARMFRVGRLIKRVDSLLSKSKTRLISMRWER